MIYNFFKTVEYEKKCLVCGKKQRFKFKSRGYYYYRCQSCGLLSTYPFPDRTTIEAHYSQQVEDSNYRLAQQYMEYYLSVYKGYVNKLEVELRSYGLSFHGLKILDIGCFTGELIEILKEKGADVYGLELQDKAVEIANKKLPGRIFKADVFNNNFPQMKFDVVILSGVIEHVMDPIKLLKRSVEVLNLGGILMLQTPNSTSFLSKILGRYWPPCAPVEHIHLFSKKSLEKSLHEIGLEHIKFRSHWKKLPIVYIYNNFRNFGPEFFKILKPFYNLLPQSALNKSLPFYIGEVIVFARKL